MGAVNARWVLVGWPLVAKCARPPRYVVRMLRGALPFPLPLALPLPKRPVGAERCPAFGPGFFMRGPALPRSPRAPLPLYVSVCVCGGVHRFGFVEGRSVSVFGAPRSASVLRALARMPDAARCAPPPASAPAFCARVVSGCAPGATWRAVGPSALNGPVGASRAPSRLL